MHRTYIGSLLAAGSVAALICAAPAQAQFADEIQLSLPAQDLSASLREVSARTGRNIIAPAELVRDRQAPAVSGPFTAEGAVRILLTGSGLDVRRVGNSLVVFQPEAGQGVGERESGAIAAPHESETIVVTGTNIRGAQPTSPVIVIGRQQIDESGATSVERLMATLPQNAQGGVNRETFAVPGAGADPTEHGAGLNLRGLGQRATLVLINGRRIAPSNTGAFVDVSLIPVSALERVEVLTDGASAIYGSDAVGGVVNFILRDRFEGVETQVQAGSATRGDGDVLQLAATAGTSWRSGRGLLSYEYRLEDAIEAGDRPYVIGLRPDTTIFPRERRHSLFGTAAQEILPGLRLEATGSWATRDTSRSFFFGGSPLPVQLEAEAESYSASGSLSYQLSSTWSARVRGGRSFIRTDERQAEPGELGLVNERFTRNAVTDIGVGADGPLFELPGGPVRVALGAEYRRENYSDDFRTLTLAVDFEQARDVAAAFLETQIPIFSQRNRRAGLERLIVTAAGRYERYDRFGSSFNPKLGVLWSPLPGLAFRSSYDTSFRAPLLSETAGVYSAIYVPPQFLFIDPAQAHGVGLALGGSNPDVQPERSRSWTVGAEFGPPRMPGLRVGLNYYSIRFSDRIALPAPSITVVGDPAFASIVTLDPDDDLVRQLIAGAQVAIDISGPGFSNGNATPAEVSAIVDGRFSNTAVTATRGLDLNFSYRFDAGSNRFILAGNANHIFSFTDRLRPTSETIDVLDTPLGPLNFRARGQAGWNRGGWSANLFLNHADGYRDNRAARDLRVDSFTTVDLGIAYDGGDAGAGWLRGTRIALHVENLFDARPPRLLPDPGTTAGLGYDPVNATGRGRFVSLQLRRTW
jgi:outer membrane receptor protein involved in Fe transport